MSYFLELLIAALAAGFFGDAAMTSRAAQVRLFPRCVDRIPPARILAHIFVNTFAASRMDDWSDAAADHAKNLFSQHGEHLEPAAGAVGGVGGGAVGHIPGALIGAKVASNCRSFCRRWSERDPALSARNGDGSKWRRFGNCGRCRSGRGPVDRGGIVRSRPSESRRGRTAPFGRHSVT